MNVSGLHYVFDRKKLVKEVIEKNPLANTEPPFNTINEATSAIKTSFQAMFENGDKYKDVYDTLLDTQPEVIIEISEQVGHSLDNYEEFLQYAIKPVEGAYSALYDFIKVQ
jgi:predicted GTPase